MAGALRELHHPPRLWQHSQRRFVMGPVTQDLVQPMAKGLDDRIQIEKTCNIMTASDMELHITLIFSLLLVSSSF